MTTSKYYDIIPVSPCRPKTHGPLDVILTRSSLPPAKPVTLLAVIHVYELAASLHYLQNFFPYSLLAWPKYVHSVEVRKQGRESDGVRFGIPKILCDCFLSWKCKSHGITSFLSQIIRQGQSWGVCQIHGTWIEKSRHNLW